MSANIDRRKLLAAGAGGAALLALPPAARAAGATVHEVEIRGFRFRPAKLKVRPGDIIRWTNHDNAPHNATAGNGSWKTPDLGKGDSAEITVTARMARRYVCTFHPGMKGALVIARG